MIFGRQKYQHDRIHSVKGLRRESSLFLDLTDKMTDVKYIGHADILHARLHDSSSIWLQRRY